MNKLRSRKFMAVLSLWATGSLLAVSGFAQTPAPAPTTPAPAAAAPAKDDTMKLEKFVVTGSFIPQPTAEPIAPVAIFSEAEIRYTGAVTPIEALRYLPSFIGNPGATEFDSNGGDGSTFVNLRGLGAGQTLALLNGRPAGNFANFSLIPIEAIDRIEVMRDGAGIIYGSAAIGGAVNVILKKEYSGFTADVYGGAASRSPGDRSTFQGSFIAGGSNDKTSVVATGSFFKERTIYARDRPNSASPDNRSRGGTNGGSPTFPGNIHTGGGAVAQALPAGFSASKSALLTDFVPLDTNTFSSNQLFNFRQFSPSAPGQKRSSFYASFEHKSMGDQLVVYGNFTYSKLTTKNGLAPAPFALDAEPAEGGPAVGSLTHFPVYNQGILVEDNGDYFSYRSIELGNRAEEQIYNDFRYQIGLKGDINKDWHWDTALTVENENFVETDTGVVDLGKFDAIMATNAFNPFAVGFSAGTTVINGVSYSWDNAKALAAAQGRARVTQDSNDHMLDGRVTGKVADLPGGPLYLAGGYEYRSGDSAYNPDSLYASGGVLGLNTLTPDFNEFSRKAVFGEIRIPIIGESNKQSWAQDFSIGALARNESQTIKGTNRVAKIYDSKSFSKTNPSVNLQYSPTDEYKLRATWSKGYQAPSAGTLFTSPGQSNPTLQDPLGFPVLAQQTIVIRGNPSLQPATSKAWSVGLVAAPKSLVKGFDFTVDFYNIEVDGIIANNASAILAANAAGQGSGFVAGNPATINPNAPFAAQIKRNAAGSLNNSGSFTALGVSVKGAVLTDYLNIASRKISGLEYTATYRYNTTDYGKYVFTVAANEFLKFDQQNGPGLPNKSYLGKFANPTGDPISPGSIPKWKGNFITRWNWKNFDASVTVNYIASYQDDPLYVLSPTMQAFYNAHTPTTDPAYAAFLATSAALAPKVGGIRTVSSWTTGDVQVGYKFNSDAPFLAGTKLSIGARNITNRLAPFAAGAFNDSYDTRTHNNVGRFCYVEVRKDF